MSLLKTALQKLVTQANARGIYNLSEMQIQSSYVVKVLEMLDWNDGGMAQGDRQDVATGKVPDILLKDANKWTLLVVECKDAGSANKLDGYYGSGKNKKSFDQQLINYCKAEGVYWGVLTNFVEWRLYTVKFGQIYQNKKYAFHDLLWPGVDKKDYIDLLSKEGLAFLGTFKRHPFCKAQGLITQDKIYYPEEKNIRDDFFLMLKGWRESLRSELWAKNNQLLPDKEKIDLYAQKILDRMIFIDVCHDKRIIGPNAHDSILYTKKQVYDELKKWFVTMDDRFNTDLFESDKYINGFEISNEVLAPIVSEMAMVDFSRLPVNIIGDVYEDYLGEILRGGKKQGIKVREDKAKFKRKSQGIYYTPEYIVNYIVTNTVGELLQKTHSFEDIKKIKVLDPACGSGSFLINAFDKLYAAYKKATPDKKDFDIKRTILQHNLYGVDLDERAVEICKLNLMLKALDKHKWDELKGRKLLPSLHLNIRHGNSLISGKSLADQEQMNLFNVYETDRDVVKLLKLHKQFYKASEDAIKHKLWDDIQSAEITLNRRLNGNLTDYFSKPDDQHPLNFEVAFPEVFSQGGFDAVMGNPPWGSTLTDDVKNYLNNNYVSKKGEAESHLYFIEKTVELVNNKGEIGLITPNTWLAVLNSNAIREHILNNATLVEITQLTKYIFESAPDIVPILVFAKRKGTACYKCKVRTTGENKINADNFDKVFINNSVSHELWLNTKGFVINIYLNPATNKMLEKCKVNTIKLATICEILYGIKTGGNEKYLSKQKTENHIVPALKTGELSRYSLEWKGLYLWWCKNLAGYRSNVSIDMPKIIVQYIRKISLQRRIIAAFDAEGKYYPLNNYSYITLKDNTYSLLYVLGVLNSAMINYYFANTFIDYNIKPTYLQQIPIRVIDFQNYNDKSMHDKIVSLVKEMLALNKTPEMRESNRLKIAAVDHEIDQLVYKLYGLSETEIKVMEGE